MNSRVHQNHKTKYHVTNWAECDQALVNRGDLTFWISPEAIKTWSAKSSGGRGAPRKYSNLAIETALTVRLLFHLPLRQTEGFLRSLFYLMGLGLDVPDHTTVWERRRTPSSGARRSSAASFTPKVCLRSKLRPRLGARS